MATRYMNGLLCRCDGRGGRCPNRNDRGHTSAEAQVRPNGRSRPQINAGGVRWAAVTARVLRVRSTSHVDAVTEGSIAQFHTREPPDPEWVSLALRRLPIAVSGRRR